MSEEYVLQLQHIRKEYPGVVALKDVTLELKKGEILALIGENGAGKSTLIKCCSGAVIPTSGKLFRSSYPDFRKNCCERKRIYTHDTSARGREWNCDYLSGI